MKDPKVVLGYLIIVGSILTPSPAAYAQDRAIGGFVGEPSGLGIKFVSDAENMGMVFNLGWSSRKDEGVDMSAELQWYVYESKQEQRMRVIWNLGFGPRVTLFSNPEYGGIASGGVSFVFPGPSGRHEIHMDAGPAIALSPHLATTLYAMAGYRFYY